MMIKTEQQYFEEAISLQTYMEQMTKLKEEGFMVYEAFRVPENDAFIELLKEKQPHILTIAEDWCGDAMLNNSIMRRIAEAAGLDIRAVYRDVDTDLIDRYLTNGGRAIPMYIFLNGAGEVIGKWGPRAPQLQQFVVEMREQLPAKEDLSFEDAQKVVYQHITNAYVTDRQLHTFVYEDIQSKVAVFLSRINGQ